jgi:hypothetical protein
MRSAQIKTRASARRVAIRAASPTLRAGSRAGAGSRGGRPQVCEIRVGRSKFARAIVRGSAAAAAATAEKDEGAGLATGAFVSAN